MAERTQNIMEKAEARFIETQKKAAARNTAMLEYQAEAKARAKKTAELRELRLARDQAALDAEASKPEKPAKPAKKRARP